MTKETCFYNPEIIHTDNCLVSTFCTAAKTLWGIDFEPSAIIHALKRPNRYRLASLLTFLNKYDLDQVNFDLIRINSQNALETITTILNCEGLCSLSVQSHLWIRLVSASDLDRFLIDESDKHSILVYGHRSDLLYVADPYNQQKSRQSWSDISTTILEPFIEICLFLPIGRSHPFLHRSLLDNPLCQIDETELLSNFPYRGSEIGHNLPLFLK